MLTWWRRQYIAGLVVFAVCMTAFGVSLSAAAAGNMPGQEAATTITGTRTTYLTHRQTRLVTVHVPARIIRRFDHIIVWRTARFVFIYRGQRHTIPPHTVRVRYRKPTPATPPVAAVIGVAPPPVTVTVPVPVAVTVPGPTTTTTQIVTSVEVVPTTVTSVSTITITLPFPGTTGTD